MFVFFIEMIIIEKSFILFHGCFKKKVSLIQTNNIEAAISYIWGKLAHIATILIIMGLTSRKHITELGDISQD